MDDPAEVKPDGVEHKLLLAKPFGAKCEFKEFPEVKHGFVSRLELHETNVARDYPIAWAGVTAFFKRILIDA
jgi:dienelactone hydrolase